MGRRMAVDLRAVIITLHPAKLYAAVSQLNKLESKQ
jgi:hypothetical protein